MMRLAPLTPARHLNPTAPKICFLDIDGVVCDFGKPNEMKPGVLEKCQALVKDGWVLVAFTSRALPSLHPLIEQGLPLTGYVAKPWASEIMVIDDILSEAKNAL
jgi:hypothetical protein